MKYWYVIITGLLTIVATTESIAQSLAPLYDGDQINTSATGIWHNKSKGLTLDISQQTITLYNDSKAGCIKDEMLAQELSSFLRYFAHQDQELLLSLRDENSTIYHFQELANVPQRCKETFIVNPINTFEYFWNMMDAHYAFFDLYGVDWQERYNTFRPQITNDLSESALFSVLSDMLEGLHDGHLSLSGVVDGEEKHFSATRTRTLGPTLDKKFYNQKKIKSLPEYHTHWFRQNMKGVKKHVLNRRGQGNAGDMVVWGKIGEIGYIKILGMEGYSERDGFDLEDELKRVHQIMNKAIEELKDTPALIVDVAFNRGGLDEVSLAIAGHFTDRRFLSHTKQAFNDPHEPQPIFVEPAASSVYLKPVALFTSEITVSAAEIFTLAMRSLPNVTHYGDATFGALSDILPKTLPNGWHVSLSNENYTDKDGVVWEGQGIKPEKHMTVFDAANLDRSYLEALKSLATMLTQNE